MSARSISRAPSEISDISRAPSGTSLHRNLSRTESMPGQEMRRSRSRSIDQGQVRPEIKRPMIRAPSGKDLFKGREVGLMRRTGSRKEIPGIRRDDSQTQPSLGLLGRKTSDPKKNRVPDGESHDRRALISRTSKQIYISICHTCQTTSWESLFSPTSSNANPRRTVKRGTFPT